MNIRAVIPVWIWALVAIVFIQQFVPQPQLTIKPEDIKLGWSDSRALTLSCSAHNETNEEWIGSVGFYVRNLDGKTLFAGTKKKWISLTIRSGEKTTIGERIPFRKIKDYETIIVGFVWDKQEVEKPFKVPRDFESNGK